MEEILIRTEDIPLADILNMFVETENDRQIVNCLKGKMPYILVGSRGVGKSFLLKVAQAELKSEFESKRSLIYKQPTTTRTQRQIIQCLDAVKNFDNNH